MEEGNNNSEGEGASEKNDVDMQRDEGAKRMKTEEAEAEAGTSAGGDTSFNKSKGSKKRSYRQRDSRDEVDENELLEGNEMESRDEGESTTEENDGDDSDHDEDEDEDSNISSNELLDQYARALMDMGFERVSTPEPDEPAEGETVIPSGSDSEIGEEFAVLKKPKPKHSWFIVPEVMNRQLGTSANKRSSELFQRRCYGSLHCVQRLELMYKLEKHEGCVNSLNFNPSGTLLASGSDDLRVVVWDWKNGKPLLSFDTKHRSNVFQSKFLQLSGDMHIVTCARDGQVRLAQVCAQEGLRSTRKLGSHRGPCHKLSVLQDQPQVVISVGEDGLILRHDLRSPKSEKILTVKNEDDREVALYSISSHPLNGNEFCVAGRDYIVRVYDQRQGVAKSPISTFHPFKNLPNYTSLHVTCAVYNHNGSEILASYNNEGIYLFDVNGPKNQYIHHYTGHKNGATIKGVNFFGPKSEFVVSGSDCGNIYFWERENESIVQWLLADDNGVVNCLEPHPQLPFLCTSGLDWNVKVWVPSYEQDPQMIGLAKRVKNNIKASLQWSDFETIEDTQILWRLWRQLNAREQIRQMGRVYDFVENANIDLSASSSSSSSSENSNSSRSDHSDDSNWNPSGCSPS